MNKLQMEDTKDIPIAAKLKGNNILSNKFLLKSRFGRKFSDTVVG